MPTDDTDRIEAALSHLESYEKDGNMLTNWSKVVKARELLREVDTETERSENGREEDSR
ncbi:hypothetical protein [Natronorubrum sp. DTA7]|uniref:hypothetical protein n=1 Tax=Natronorubrum sp. DTA7 TaxID=3447016 RepID=UPI003F87DF79